MANLAPRKYIDPPNTQARPRVGLLTVANGPLTADNHELAGGVEYNPVLCGPVHVYPQNCSAPPTKTFDAIDAIAGGDPFALYSSIQCGTYGYDFDELARRARTRLDAKEQNGLEAHLWGVSTDNPPAMFQTVGVVTNVTPGGGITNIVTGFSVLEQALADCYGLPGIIHVTPAAMPYLRNHTLIDRDKDGKFYTDNGNVVVSEFGASGRGPADEAIPAGGGWLYATGPINIWRGDVIVPDPRQTFDRTNNQHKVLAERPYVMTIECCALAIKVTTWEGNY